MILDTCLSNLIEALEGISEKHPLMVVMLMHEVTRNLYPNDPHIPFSEGLANEHPLTRIERVMQKAIKIASLFRQVGGYSQNFELSSFDDVKDATGDLYGKVWQTNPIEIVQTAKNIIIERFTKNRVSLKLIEGARILDMGCGSGRYSCALSLLGATEVVAVDIGEMGLRKGESLAQAYGLRNIIFKKANFVNLPFETASFDFIFCNGTTHHSEDMARATAELYRVLKPGCYAWYYVYGSGGVYWGTILAFNKLMKRIKIPKEYSMEVLALMGMPSTRHIFIDHWYVPILTVTSKEDFEVLLHDTGFSDFRRCIFGRETDCDERVEKGSDGDREMWGDGELRYLVRR